MKQHIVVVDDEQDIRELITGILEDEGYYTTTASSASQAMYAIYAQKPDLAIIDIWLKDDQMDGLELLAKIKNIYPDMPVIIISGHGNIETAVNAIKKGAYDYLEKPFKVDKILNTIEKAMEVAKLRDENKYLRKKPEKYDIPLLGNSPSIVKVRAQIKNIAQKNARLLIQGEKSTGKTSAAKMLHKESDKRQNPLMIVDFATLNPREAGVELFGSEFAGKLEIGVLEKAKDSSILLKEVEFIPIDIKKKLISAIQKKYHYRIAGKHGVKINCRIISTLTIKNNQMQNHDYTTKTLLDLLGVFKINMPALAERRQDITDIAAEFIKNHPDNRPAKPIKTPDNFFEVLKVKKWQGNIDSLKNFIERLMIIAGDDNEITEDMLYQNQPRNKGQIFDTELLLNYNLKQARQLFEKQYITGQLRRFNNNISRTSDFIGTVRSTLHRKLKDLKINVGS